MDGKGKGWSRDRERVFLIQTRWGQGGKSDGEVKHGGKRERRGKGGQHRWPRNQSIYRVGKQMRPQWYLLCERTTEQDEQQSTTAEFDILPVMQKGKEVTQAVTRSLCICYLCVFYCISVLLGRKSYFQTADTWEVSLLRKHAATDLY